jgi:hypothetical protein
MDKKHILEINVVVVIENVYISVIQKEVPGFCPVYGFYVSKYKNI